MKSPGLEQRETWATRPQALAKTQGHDTLEPNFRRHSIAAVAHKFL